MSHSISKLWMPSLGHSWNQCTQPQAPPWETQGYVESHRIVWNHRVVQSTMCHFQHLENAMLTFSALSHASTGRPRPQRPQHPRRRAAPQRRASVAGGSDGTSDSRTVAQWATGDARDIYIYVFLPTFISKVYTYHCYISASMYLCIYIGLSRL